MRVPRCSCGWPLIGVAVLACLVAFAGCDRLRKDSVAPGADSTLESANGIVDVSDDPLQQFRDAVNQGDWDGALRVSTAVLTQYPDDAEVIYSVARAAQKMNKPEMAADLLVDACHAESLSNLPRLQIAKDALLRVGRLHDCMDLMEASLAVSPSNHDFRLQLYDMCWGTEDRPRANLHGEYLVRQRRFDLLLLLSLGYTDSRTDRLGSFVEMAKRFKGDKRPLVAQAKAYLSESRLDQSAAVLRDVLAHHPEHLPAIALLCEVLIASAKDDEFVAVAKTAPTGIEEFPNYWIAVGDWCGRHQRNEQSVRAYWEAAKRDTEGRQCWTKLATALKTVGAVRTVGALKTIGETDHELDHVTVRAIEKRATIAALLSDSKSRFRRHPSQAIAIDIAKRLQDVGRLWEAEAWAAIAMTLPPDESVDAAEVRRSIVASLNRESPWQLTNGFPELQMNLAPLREPWGQFGDQSLAENRSTRSVGMHSQTALRSDNLQLTNEADERGLRFFGRTADHLERPGVMHYQTLGCGGGAIDFDLDGWCDLYLAAAGGTPPNRDSQPNTMWRNQDGRFLDVTDYTQTGDTGFGQGIAVGDINEDGFPDLLVMNYGPNVMFVNNGDGTFTDVSERVGLNVAELTLRNESDQEIEWSTSAAIADFDGDGFTDLFVLNYGNGLEPVHKKCLGSSKDLVRACAPLNFKAARDRLMRNSGTGTFVNESQRSFAGVPPGRGLGVIAGALDASPGVDFFVANDQSLNQFWSRSDEDATLLRESAVVRGLGSSDHAPFQGSMGMATGDFDGDGDFDFYVTNFHKEYNLYHEQVADGIWRDQTNALHLSKPTLPVVGFGAEAADLDCDGTLELLVTNGHVDHYPGEKSAPYAQRMQVFQRRSDGGYESIEDSIAGEYVAVPHVGRALWSLDVDRDGATDFAVTHQTEPVALLMNRSDQSGNSIEFQLRGRVRSRDAIGAIVELRSGGRRWNLPLTSGAGYLCSSERIIRVGVGDVEDPCSVSVAWPDGPRQDFGDLAIGRRWLLVEGDQDAFEMESFVR